MNAVKIINKRKELWQRYKDIDKDREYREATATYMLSEKGIAIRDDIKSNPEYLIELFFIIVDKEQNTVPFFLNEIQTIFLSILNNDKELYEQGKKLHLKYLILKGRQAGFTSFINAYQLACSITQKNFSGYTLADNADNTENIFSDKAKYYFDNLPTRIKPSTKYSSRKELDFSKDDGKGMNSKWRVATAGNIDAGRSKTLNFFHGCLSADSRILSTNGSTIAMGDIRVGDKVNTSNGDIATVKNKVYTGVKELYKINMWLSNEPIYATKDHKILTDKGYKEVKDITNKDYVCLPKIELTNEIRAYKFELPNLERQQSGGTKHIESATIPLNYDFGYYLGYYLAEGHIKKQSSKEGRYSRVEFAYEEDEVYIEDAYRFASQYTTSRKDTQDEGTNRGRTYLYGTFLAHLTNDICGRVKDKHIPDWFFKTNKEFIKGVLAGYFSGDGSKIQEDANGLYKVHRMKATTIIESIGRQIRKLVIAMDYGVPALRYKHDVYRYGKRVNPTYTIDASGRCAYELEKIVGINHEGTFQDRSVKYKKMDGNYYVRVKSIEYDRTEDCYDIEVNHTEHNYETTIGVVSNSEVAFWKDSKRILIGLSEAFTKNAIVILETTANGFNEYKNMWDADNNYKNLFFEWWLTKEYTLEFESDSVRNAFMTNVNAATEGIEDAESEVWCYSRCKWLLEYKGLTEGQIYWYYNKWKDKGSSIKQEYPCSAEEAFLASGKNFFNIEKISRRKDELVQLYKRHKIKRGYFVYEYGTSIWTNEKTIQDHTIQFIEDNELGYINIYNDSIELTEPFTIGADTAGAGSDSNTAHVLDTKQNQVAVIKINKDEDLFADQLYCLGMMYNKALISVEVNFSTYVVNTLVNREYPRIYIRENRPDAISKQIQKLYGFNTNRATRPAMLAELKTLVRDRIECINDIATLDEMFSFIIDEKSKPIAIDGEHDDLIMALAIALYSQEQQLNELTIPANTLEGYYTDTELEDLGYSAWEIQQYKQGQPLYVR